MPDVEAALEEAFDEPVVSKSTVSRICQDTRQRDRAWCARRLEGHDLVYLFFDAIYLKLPRRRACRGRPGRLGRDARGEKVLLALQLGSRESYESWLDFGRDSATTDTIAPPKPCAALAATRNPCEPASRRRAG